MRFWIILLLIATTGTAFGRLGETEQELKARYGKPVWVGDGLKYNPYFDKLIDFKKEGISIFCYLHAGRCVRIEYSRNSGFNNAEVAGFTQLNHVDQIRIERTATSLTYTLKKDLPDIASGSKKGIRKMRKDFEAAEHGT
ncbi:MAG: hypothetical protein JO232_00390 [Verrucomicrobia bacterium]|nr:hypothetical protein [Verrucomicrobiota bacterium]